MSEASAAAQPKVNQELQAQYNTFKSTIQQLESKIGELESEAEEHTLVIKTLNDLEDKSRKCFRMIGGVLVEQPASEVIPQLETNNAGLKSVLSTLAGDYKKTQDQLEAWRTKNKVQIVRTA